MTATTKDVTVTVNDFRFIVTIEYAEDRHDWYEKRIEFDGLGEDVRNIIAPDIYEGIMDEVDRELDRG